MKLERSVSYQLSERNPSDIQMGILARTKGTLREECNVLHNLLERGQVSCRTRACENTKFQRIFPCEGTTTVKIEPPAKSGATKIEPPARSGLRHFAPTTIFVPRPCVEAWHARVPFPLDSDEKAYVGEKLYNGDKNPLQNRTAHSTMHTHVYNDPPLTLSGQAIVACLKTSKCGWF